MARSGNAISLGLVILATGALAHGLWALAEGADLSGLYWLVAALLALGAASDRERFLAAR